MYGNIQIVTRDKREAFEISHLLRGRKKEGWNNRVKGDNGIHTGMVIKILLKFGR